MRRRTLAIGIVTIAALLAGTAYAGRGLFLRAQFGRQSSIGYPVSVLQELCSQPADSLGLHTTIVDGPGCRNPQGGMEYCWQSQNFCSTQNHCVAKYDGMDLPECGVTGGAMPGFSSPVAGLGAQCHQFHCCLGGTYFGTTDNTSPGGSGNGISPFVLSCADADATCMPTFYGTNYLGGGMTYRCCNDPDPYVCIRQASASSAPASCGDGVVNGSEECDDGNTTDTDACRNSCKNAKCGDDVKQTGVEECDDGVKNIPSDVAHKGWNDISPGDIAVLKRSKCLDTCQVAECSDGKDNDKKNGTDGADASCHDGAYGNGALHLIGYDNEKCPMCQLDEEKDDTVAFSPSVNTLVAALIVRQHEVPAGDVDNLDQAYCKSGKKTIQGTDCSCTGANEVCFAKNETDATGTITALGECDCQKVKPLPDTQTWTWACKTDKDCSKGWRCAYYSTYKYLSGTINEIDIYRCKKLLGDGEQGCRSRWDCKSRYTNSGTTVGPSGTLTRRSASRTKCIELNQGTPRCCNPDEPDMGKSCKRPGLSGTATIPIPELAQCQTGGGAGNPGGGDGGWGDGGGSGGSDSGSTGSSGSNGSNGSNSSGSQCNNQNPCIGVTVIGGTLTYTMPPQCPLTGNKRTCYTRCIAGINAGSGVRDCNVMCATSDDDLNMCDCNPDYGDCSISCAEDFVDCNMLCAYDTNPTACRSDCRGEYRSCLDSCGRMCPASADSSSRRSTSSITSSKNSQSFSNSSKSSGSSRSSSSSSQSNSNGSNNSNNSNGSQSSRSADSSRSNKSSQGSDGRSSSSKKSTVSSVASTQSSISAHSSHISNSSNNSQSSHSSNSSDHSDNSNSSNHSNSSNSSNKSQSSNSSNSSNKSQSSNSLNSSNKSQSSNSLNSSNDSQSSKNSHSSDHSNNSNSSNRSNSSGDSHSSTSSRSSSSNSASLSSGYSSSLRSSTQSSNVSSGYCCINNACTISTFCSLTSTQCTAVCGSSASNKSYSSTSVTSGYCCTNNACFYGLGCTATSNQCLATCGTNGIGGGIGDIGFGGTVGGTITGLGGDIGSQGGTRGACTADQQCPLSARCVLSRCLTVTDLAQLPSFCGNARLDAGEQCDNGADNSNRPNAYCRPDCTLGRCSDGIVDTPLEQCDDGNTFNNDGCSSTCQPERGAPSTILPATTIELPFTNKGDIGTNTGDQGSVIGDGDNGLIGSALPSSIPSTPDTGPAALAVMIAGGAAGWLYRRRKN